MTGAKVGSAFGPWGTVIGGVLGGAVGLFSGKSKGPTTPSYQPLDISKIITDAREGARTNLASSIQLEQQYLPGTAALRGTANESLQALAAGQTPGIQARDTLLQLLGKDAVSNPLLEESASRILGNLRLGGALGPDVQAQAMQAALQKGGAAGISGSGAARGLVARDLGLTSLGLEQQRIEQAHKAGQAMATLRLQDIATRGNITGNAATADANRFLNLAQLIDARAYPEAGLNPASIANLYIADNNARNQINTNAAAINSAQRNANLNAMLGFGSQVAGGGYDSTIGSIAGLFGRGSAGTGVGGEEDELASLMSSSRGP